jgi:hypothetical protein
VWAVFLGPIRTTPYKIYAALAPAAGVAVAPLLVVTVPARLLRFVIAAWVAGWLLPRLTPRWPPLRRTWLVVIFWIVNYGLYWSLQGTG